MGQAGALEGDRRREVGHRACRSADRRLIRLLRLVVAVGDPALRGHQRALDRLQLAADEGQARLGQQQPRAGVDQLGGQGGEPAL
jgi:hypothetical protein